MQKNINVLGHSFFKIPYPSDILIFVSACQHHRLQLDPEQQHLICKCMYHQHMGENDGKIDLMSHYHATLNTGAKLLLCEESQI